MNAYYSSHAFERKNERRLTDWQVQTALLYGHKFIRNGARFVRVHREDIPPEKRGKKAWNRLIGITVVLDLYSDVIVTVYRDTAISYRKVKPEREYEYEMEFWSPQPSLQLIW